MAISRPHPQAEAVYRITAIEGGTYDVEIRVADAEPAMVRGFATSEDAEQWVSRQKERISSSAGKNSRFRRYARITAA
jgi:hypothetical protein